VTTINVDDEVGMETYEKFVGAIDETSGISQEDVRGIDREVGVATLSGGNDDMEMILMMQFVKRT